MVEHAFSSLERDYAAGVGCGVRTSWRLYAFEQNRQLGLGQCDRAAGHLMPDEVPRLWPRSQKAMTPLQPFVLADAISEAFVCFIIAGQKVKCVIVPVQVHLVAVSAIRSALPLPMCTGEEFFRQWY